MKLVSKRMSINQDTFAPEMEVVLRLPVELGQDSNALSGVNIENRVQYPVRVGGYEGAPINYPNNFLGQIDEVRVAKGTWKPETGFALPISQYQ